MLDKIDWPKSRSYRTGTDYEPFQFYLDALCQSKRFDLLLGYFSSAAINALSLGFAKFLYNGGILRIVANHILSKEDKELIQKGQNNINTLLDLSNIKKLRDTLNVYDQHFFECLAWLISQKRMEIIIVKPIGQGIVHYKSGVFSNGENSVYFKASCNFTAYGLLENAEEVECFLSWEHGSTIRIESQDDYFEEIFTKRATHVEYLDTEDVEIAIKNEFGDKSIQELLIQEKELLEKKRNHFKNPRIEKKIKSVIEEIEELSEKPHFPFPQGPRDYQKEAYNNWIANNYQGIFAMATGTGKTITSLNCVLQESSKSSESTYHAIVLVPTLTLVEQWKSEALSFNFNSVIKISSKDKWEKELATTLSTAKRIPISFIVIATYASFVKEKFFRLLNLFPKDTIVIADEAHNLGSPSVLEKAKELLLSKRIGLSATPKRVYDIEGSLTMEAFFNDEEPYTYSFSMERAIAEGILCKYYYYPHIIHLTDGELKKYIEISKKLTRLYNSETQEFTSPEIAERLLLKRKRIIHKAENKLQETINILQRRYLEQNSLKYTFVYVPEGQTEEPDEWQEENETVENIRIINQYTREIGKINPSIRVNQFTSGMKDRDEILSQFREGKIDVIASMKCLDEGVDIPRAECAIFCSSTGNPRQFIQRRGRILRKHENKNIAIIHDLVVIPNLDSSSKTSETFYLERKMVERELERVMHFASLAINPYETEEVFSEVCNHYDLNIYTIHQNLKMI